MDYGQSSRVINNSAEGKTVAPDRVPVLFLVSLPDRSRVRISPARDFDTVRFLLNRWNLSVWCPKLRQTLDSLPGASPRASPDGERVRNGRL